MHEPRSDWLALASTPREIPLSTRLGMRFLSLLFQMSCLVACLSLACLFFIAKSDVLDRFHFDGELTVEHGSVSSVGPTGFSEGGGRHDRYRHSIQRFDYTFEHDGESFTGVSYSSTSKLAEGAACVVEFVAGEPRRSRIRGLRSAEFGSATLFGLLAPATAFALFVWSQISAARALHLLEVGRPVTGRVIEMKAFGRKRRGRTRSFRATVEFSLAAGAAQRVKLVTQKEAVFRDERGVRLLYDADRPKLARVFDDLPIKVTLDGRGRIAAMPWSRVAHALWLPCATLAGCIVLVYALC